MDKINLKVKENNCKICVPFVLWQVILVDMCFETKEPIKVVF